MWSVGCIFAELLGRKPLFPGKDYLHQLTLITDVIGSPDDEDIEYIESEKARRYIRCAGWARRAFLVRRLRSLPRRPHVPTRSLPCKPCIPFDRIYPNANPLAVDILNKLLLFNPAKRISVDEALAHPYLASLHDPSDEPLADEPFSFQFEATPMSKQVLKSLITQEMLYFEKKGAGRGEAAPGGAHEPGRAPAAGAEDS